MDSSHHDIRVPTAQHPVRWAALALGVVALLVATASPARAHSEHSPLPEGFEARITGVVDAAGAPAPATDAVAFTMAPDGARLTVEYSGAAELIVDGEQASEPLLRMAGGSAEVNAASPQAQMVEGADVDPARTADLLDLVWERAKEDWVPLASGSTVSFMDHRAVPGHAPVRADFGAGDVAASWRIPFTLDGVEYVLTGDVVAVAASGGGGLDLRTIVTIFGGVVFVAWVVWAALRWRAVQRGSRGGAAAPADRTAKGRLVGARR